MGVVDGKPSPLQTPARPWVILLIDDEPDILRSLKDLIEMSLPGTKVIPASNGRDGLDILDKERVDVIISDFRMPGMDGIEFLYQARRHHPDIARVMLTAFADEELARRAISEAFVDEFISKAARPKEFLDRILHRLDYLPKAFVAATPT